jgi:hypothetical protein
MTSAEMKQEFLILYDKITNFSAPGYEDIEISILLTKAQERVFLKIYNPSGNKYKEGFEETEGRRKDLNELIKGVSITTPSSSQTNVLPNGRFYDLPTDCLFAISEEVTTVSADPCKNNKRVKIKPITHDEYSINVRNPFKKPSIDDYVWRLDYENRKHELITDGTFTVGSYHLRYIKNLNPIIIGANTVNGVAGPLDCELNSIIHNRIVDEAVKMAVGITDPELYQIKNIEQQGGE